MSELDSLREITKIVADTGDFNQIKDYNPEDSTTNPSLLLKAVLMPEHKKVFNESIDQSKSIIDRKQRIFESMIDIAVSFGLRILELISGKVSIEVDARLSFDTQKTVLFAHKIIEKFENHGIVKSRILIKIAATWEGIKAAEILEKEGISCNLTLVFDLVQAVSCAESDVTLISPFVGRISDWYRENSSFDSDPGVSSVTKIFNYYRTHGYKTIVMGASFRNISQIRELAGCDALTISPKFLNILKNSREKIVKKLDSSRIKNQRKPEEKISEALFRRRLNENKMATEKLSEGINIFSNDTKKLESLIKERIDLTL